MDEAAAPLLRSQVPHHEIPRILCDTKNHHCVHTARYLRLCRAKSSTPSRSISLISTLILSSHLRLGLPSVFFYQNPVWLSLFPHTYYMPCSSHLPLKSGNSTSNGHCYEHNICTKRYSSTMILTDIRVFDLRTNAYPLFILQDYYLVWMSKRNSLHSYPGTRLKTVITINTRGIPFSPTF